MPRRKSRSLKELAQWLDEELSTLITDEEEMILLGLKMRNVFPKEKMPEIDEEDG